MHIVLHVSRRVIVHNELDVFDVQTSLSHIGCNQNLGFSLLEGMEGMIALALIHIAMQLNNGSPSAGERLIKSCGSLLGLYKDQRSATGLLQFGEDVLLQESHLVSFVPNSHNVLGDVGIGTCIVLTAHLDVGWILGELPRNIFHLWRPGGGVQGRLTDLWQIVDELLNLRLKAHIQHSIGLIQDQVVADAQTDAALPQEVVEPSRGRGHALRLVPQLSLLISLRCTAVNTGRANGRRLSEAIAFLIDLLTQLSGGSHDQHGRAIVTSQAIALIALDFDVAWQQIAQGLTTPCLCDANHILTVHEHRPCVGLNGCGRLEAGILQELHQAVWEFPGAAAVIEGAPGSHVLSRDDMDLVIILPALISPASHGDGASGSFRSCGDGRLVESGS
mmetsp:Transcript_28505/g.47051  ORF Transcript_28505/g.47051 Transcript_28505/m.47051 type:complete len:390 (+) Transcript_28505:455-1624(+)